MVFDDKCTRAEAEDIASAVTEGCDAFILSGETALGKFSVESVTQLTKIIAEAECVIDYEQVYNE